MSATRFTCSGGYAGISCFQRAAGLIILFTGSDCASAAVATLQCTQLTALHCCKVLTRGRCPVKHC